ncbi:hypothetical protein OHD16_21350 [Sphingobacterium sp. ML3W]|uniref:hypothetical protein n=1 Tax=Sphingobacterium sp. ML3W TaxID=1538644 RepID=UPI00249A6426|nr:hypothetical protein [Sphingobacterium sp. ML3W]WFA77278.1 hypothetical protein OGI71_14490 [Sphingobacterium sp. ML3W]
MVLQALIFPRKDLEAKICDYRYGKRFAVQQNTDSGLRLFANFQLFQAFKYGIKYTMFTNAYNPGGGTALSNTEYVNMVGTGLVELEHYFSTDKWINPVTGLDELIPDHSSKGWTNLGATYFNVNAGDPKAELFPNHGQELYDISGGKYGYDVVNGVAGVSNLSELKGIKERQTAWFDSLELKPCSAFSYRNGRDISPEVYKKLYLFGRQSNTNGAYYYYGKSKIDGIALGNDLQQSRKDLVDRRITTRWVDSYISTNPGAQEKANQLLRDKTMQAYTNRGAYTDFSHHHSAKTNQALEDLCKTLGTYLDSSGLRNECWIAGFGELSEYYWFRELTKKAVATVMHSKVYITLLWEDLKTIQNGLSDGILLEQLNTPLSIEIDLTGTPLADKSIKSTGGKLMRLGNNKYLVDFPFRNAVEGIKSVVLEVGEGNYYDNVSLSVSYYKNGNQVTIYTNKDTRAVVFTTSTDIYSIAPVLYSNDLNTSHTFNIDTANINYVGVVDELGKTRLIEI